MMIYELVCEKVCHAICHMVFNSVEGQAQMIPREVKFFFIMRGTKVEVEFDANTYFIKINGGDNKLTNYNNYDTTDDIAYDIIATAELLMD